MQKNRRLRSAISKLKELSATQQMRNPTGGTAAAADEVSTAIANIFNNPAGNYSSLGAQASAFHDQFTGLINSGGSGNSGD